MYVRRVEQSEDREVRRWLNYRGRHPTGIYEVTHTCYRIGAVVLGAPTRDQLDPAKILEVVRLKFDDCRPNDQSACLAAMRKHVRIWFPAIKLIIAHVDAPADGIVYSSDNWAPLGRRKKRNETKWKYLWARTP